jgi:hypothetical protein
MKNDINQGFIEDCVPTSHQDPYEEEEAIMIHHEQSEDNESNTLNGGGAQFNFASLLQEHEKKDEERRQKMAAVHIQDYMQLDDKITTGDLHNQISEIQRDLTDTNKHLMVGNRRDQVLNKHNLFNPGLSIGSPDDEVNLNSESLAFIKSNHKLKRHPHDNSIEDDLIALH